MKTTVSHHITFHPVPTLFIVSFPRFRVDCLECLRAPLLGVFSLVSVILSVCKSQVVPLTLSFSAFALCNVTFSHVTAHLWLLCCALSRGKDAVGFQAQTWVHIVSMDCAGMYIP